ncbi:uncharacterized protein C19orf44 homolog isoform X2 [Thamnophis elegans]|uniref:uncharacterized protein C19orf44 homolog isoform X2 n=1 Tax=Thamnophis elegans TaxID=35005 RepID=UPI0013785455|nr:uncharacterized protein C19orf44 homolog isoform X2 [Thamnophis elegans]
MALDESGRNILEQEEIGKSKPPIQASSSSTLCLSVIPTDSDLSNLSSSKSPCVGREETGNVGPAGTTRVAQPGSRFLKQKPQNVQVDIQQAGLGPISRVGLGAASKGRSNAILRKLAQIESKIQSRKTKQSTEQMIPVMDVELSLSESSKDFELRTGGLKFLKKTARLKESVKAQMKNVTLADTTGDSKEDADTYRQEVSQKSKGQEDKFKFQPNGKLLPETSSSSRSLPEESQVNRPLYHSPYSPNRDTRASHVASCSSSPPSMKYSPADTICHNRSSNYQKKSLSEQSIIQSLDELFSEVTDVQNDISSNSDFRVNILSLDELEPCQKTELKEEVIEAVEKLNKNLGGTVLSSANPQNLFKTSAVSLEEEENLEETDISEQLSSSSAGYSPCKEESLNNTEYSEDFEPSSFSPTSKEAGESSSEKSDGRLGASVHSIQSHLSSPCCPSVAPKCTKAIKKIEVKEVAVQTGSFSLAYHRLQYDIPAVVGHAIQQNSAEAPCFSNHNLNMEVIEALSVYNPSISALNNMLKQNLLLIQQSIEINRHLHASFVASLEEEEYHYHTLEEAKMVIFVISRLCAFKKKPLFQLFKTKFVVLFLHSESVTLKIQKWSLK